MKKILPSLFASIFLFSVTAQNTNIASHVSPKIISSNVVSINSKNYYMESTGTAFLVGKDNNGQNLFNIQLPNIGGNNVAYKLIRTTDDKLLTIIHKLGGCDYFPTPETIITKCDTLGVIEFSVSLQRQIRDITQHTDGSLYMVHTYDPPLAGNNPGANILHYSSAGVALPPITNSFTIINSVLALQNGNLLINGVENGVIKNVEMSTTGTIVNSSNASFYISSFKISASQILYGLSANGSIQSYSTNLTALNNSSLPMLPNIRVTDFNLRNDSLFCTGYDTVAKKPYYGLLGGNLTPLYQTLAPYKNTFPTGVGITNLNRVSIVTHGNSNQNAQMKHVGLYQTSITGSLVSKYDVGVIGYSVLSSTFQGMNYMYFVNLASIQLAVQVKNFGTDIIADFYLNYEGLINCGQPYHQKFNVTINPNAVVTVTTTIFNMPLMSSSYNPSSGTFKYNGNLCISTSVPNSENDIDIDNDSWCQLQSFEPVGIRELTQMDNSIKLFPNPSQNYFMIEADNKLTKIEIINAAGELIHTELPDKQELKIDTQVWPKGIYFVKLKTEQGITLKKWVKD